MPKPSWENLDDFLGTEDEGGFAFPALISFKAGGSRQVKGVIFDDPYLNAEAGEYDMDTRKPRAWAKQSDFAGCQRGDTITIQAEAGAETFDILTEPQPDGTGMMMLELSPQPPP